MRCPRCSSTEDRVIHCRISEDGPAIRRRREGNICGLAGSTTAALRREGRMEINPAENRSR
jgi:transcriptional repressor NrdR